MTISEIALLKLKTPHSLQDPALRKKLSEVQSGLHEFTGHCFCFFQQIEDPSFMYLLGQWESLESHYKDMHGSTSWKEQVMVMSSYFEFQWMAHYDLLIQDLDVDNRVLQMMRFSMSVHEKASFADTVTGVLSAYDAPADTGILHGWKVDANREKEEFVVLSSWGDAPAMENSVRLRGCDLSEKLGRYASVVDNQCARKVL